MSNKLKLKLILASLGLIAFFSIQKYVTPAPCSGEGAKQAVSYCNSQSNNANLEVDVDGTTYTCERLQRFCGQ